MKFLYILPIILLWNFTSCDSYSHEILFDLGNEEILSSKEPGLEVSASVHSRESNVIFGCSAVWTGSPLDARSTRRLSAKICVAGKCEKFTGGGAEITLWKVDYKLIKSDTRLFCSVYQQEWYTMEGISPFTTVLETFPERVIYGVAYKIIRMEGKTIPENRYCMDGFFDEEWNCIAWE